MICGSHNEISKQSYWDLGGVRNPRLRKIIGKYRVTYHIIGTGVCYATP